MTTFIAELRAYVGRVNEFERRDWALYVAWVGLIFGLFASSLTFLMIGRQAGVVFPAEAMMVPIGAAIFTASIAVDTIGHRTIYRAELRKGEGLVHQLTIACGVSSCIFLCAAYTHRAAFWIPAMVATALSLIYSLVDEVFHWRRYVAGHSDRVEMWSHLGIMCGHSIMMLGWWVWFWGGYVGVTETLAVLNAQG